MTPAVPLLDAPKEALAFLALLDPEANGFTFLTFDDRGENAKLTRVFHGTLEGHAAALAALNWRGAGVFVTVNQTDGRGRKARNITRVRAVFADLDGAPIDPVLRSELKPHTVIESSAGRFHAYWRVADLPLDAFENVQRAIAERFGGDPAVHDLPRVMRLPGFLHRKGEPFETRILKTHDAPPYSAAQILAAFPPPAAPLDRQEAEGDDEFGEGLILKGGRDNFLTSEAGVLRYDGADYEKILAGLRVINAERCRPPKPDKALQRIARSVQRYAPVPEFTEAGNGRRFATQHDERALFCIPEQAWLIFGHGRWRTDEANRINRLAVRTATSFRQDQAQARKVNNKIREKQCRAWVKTSLRDRALQAAVRQARDLLAVNVADLDGNHWLLNFKNGTYDLKYHNLRAADPKDLLTRRLPYAWDPAAQCPEFDVFLDSALAGDQPMISFLWRCIGYSLTGETNEQIAFVLQGPTRSGKTTTLEVLQALLGEYSWAAEGRTLEGGRQAGVGDDIVLLRGKRVLVYDEVPMDLSLNESFLKRLISGGTLSGRALWRKGINFESTLKVWLGSNRLPVRGLDDAIWRRLVLIPFEVQVPLEKIDLKLRRRLMRERAGVMNRALAGLVDYQRRGLKPPARSIKALDEYRLEQDSMGGFFQACIIDRRLTKPGACVSFRELFERYEYWAGQETSRRVLTETAFGRQLGIRGFGLGRKTIKGKREVVRFGLELIDDKSAF